MVKKSTYSPIHPLTLSLVQRADVKRKIICKLSEEITSK